MTLLAQAQEALQTRLTSERILRLAGDLIRYAGASFLALALDYGVLRLVNEQLGVDYHVAAAFGFLSGLALIYMLSVRYVFQGRRRRAARIEILGFLVTGVLGLLLTELLMHLFVGDFSLSVALAKLPTAGFVFLFNFATRRALLFKECATDAFQTTP
jgi:putative flippase GtrA